MALINCSECDKQISDKATNCPNCGNPINETTYNKDDEFICCPQCHSKDLHSEQKGFSGGKALVGSLFAGNLGLLAGTFGSKDVQITCLKCANRFNAGEAVILYEGQKKKEIDAQIIDFTRNGNILEAVKFYKDQTRLGLVESKNYVENLASTHGIKKTSKGGCAGVMLLIIVFVGLCYFII